MPFDKTLQLKLYSSLSVSSNTAAVEQVGWLFYPADRIGHQVFTEHSLAVEFARFPCVCSCTMDTQIDLLATAYLIQTFLLRFLFILVTAVDLLYGQGPHVPLLLHREGRG